MNQERNRLDSERYIRLYNTNPRDLNNYDLVIDTTHFSPQKIVEKILEEFQQRIINNI
jgi:cytidylate kinase